LNTIVTVLCEFQLVSGYSIYINYFVYIQKKDTITNTHIFCSAMNILFYCNVFRNLLLENLLCIRYIIQGLDGS